MHQKVAFIGEIPKFSGEGDGDTSSSNPTPLDVFSISP